MGSMIEDFHASPLLAYKTLKMDSLRNAAFGPFFFFLNDLRETDYQFYSILLTFTTVSDRVAHWRKIAAHI